MPDTLTLNYSYYSTDEYPDKKGSVDIEYSEITPAKMKLTASAADMPLPFGGVENAKALFIETPAPLKLKLNGSTSEIPVNKLLILSADTVTGLITSATLSNPDTENPVIFDYLVLE
jgi:hypothetical protein